LPFGESSNCDITTADYRYTIDYDDYAIYFAARCMTQSSVSGSLLYGAELILGKDIIKVTADGCSIYNDYKFSCDAAFTDSQYGFQVEIRIGIKDDMKNQYNAELRLIDERGSYSNKYDIVLIGKKELSTQHTNSEPEQTTQKAKPTEPKTDKTVIQKPNYSNQVATTTVKCVTTQQNPQIAIHDNYSDEGKTIVQNGSSQGGTKVDSNTEDSSKISFDYECSSEKVNQIAAENINVNPLGIIQRSSSQNRIFFIIAALLIICAVLIIAIVNKKAVKTI